MSNTITNLIPTLYKALNKVSRELTGMVAAVMRDSSGEGVGKDQTINIPIVGAATSYDITPGTDPADNGDATPGNTTMTISKSKQSPVRWNGEEEKQMAATGIFADVHADRFAQAMRVLVNEVEADLAALYPRSSNGYGVAGTTPYASTLADSAQALKMLLDNGAPTTDLQQVIDTTAGAALRTLAQLNKQNEAGSDDMLRRGVLLDLHGQAIRESAQIAEHTAGTAASATTDAAGYAVGITSIVLASAGTGTILVGDVITFAGDSTQYVVVTGDADVSGGGTIVLQEPGLKQAIVGATAITMLATHTANLAFDRNAIALITRAPAMPEGGDSADDVMNLTDPASGLVFQVAVYRQYKQVKYEVGLAWGVKAVTPEHIVRILG